jgi:chromosome segregation ATPase
LIEQALFLAIGFLAAALAAVAAAPLVSRRAMRLAVARARLRAPVSEKQAIADADALRAQHAVDHARIQRKLTLAEEASAGLRVSVGRQAAEIIRLRSEIAGLNIEVYDLRAEGERLAAHERELKATIGASRIAVHDAFIQRDRASAALSEAHAHASELDAETSRLRARLAVSTARAEYLEGRVDSLMEATRGALGKAEQTAAELEVERGRAAALEERLAAAAAESRSLAEQAPRAAAQHRKLAEAIAELEQRLRLSEKARADAMIENGRRLAELADREAALAFAAARGAALEARLASLASDVSSHDHASSLRTETLAAAHAAMGGSLRTARAERETLQRENDSLRNRATASGDPSSSVDGQLRESIGRLGREVVRLFSTQKGAEGKDSPAADREPPGAREVENVLVAADGKARGLGKGPLRRAGRSRAPER